MDDSFVISLRNGSENWTVKFDLHDAKDAARQDPVTRIIHLTKGRKVETLSNDLDHEIGHIELPEVSEKKVRRLERSLRIGKKALLKFLSDNPRFAK